MWTVAQLAYLAGIIDGEGCVYIYKRKFPNHIDYFPRLQLMNTSKDLLDWIISNFGGLVYERKRSNPKWKIRYEWYTQREFLDRIAPAILPYLVIKKRQVQILIEFRQTFIKRYRPIPNEISDLRTSLCSQLSVLNKRGL